MAYASGRVFHDADGHIMELPDFMARHADPDIRQDLMMQPGIWANLLARSENAEGMVRDGRHSAEHVTTLRSLGDGLLAGPKGFGALGAFNAGERSEALDRLGFSSQLIFPSFVPVMIFDPARPSDWRYRAARASNRAMGEFCAQDKRMKGVGLLPLDDPQRSLEWIDEIIALGLSCAFIPAQPCGDRSPGHSDLDPVWARLAETRLPFVLHIGGADPGIDPRYLNTGRDTPVSINEGEQFRGKEFAPIHQPFETFLTMLVLDGVLERHPGLRGGVIECGAGWVPALLRRLDWVAHAWSKAEPELRAFTRSPSQQIIDQLVFTPFVREDVGQLIRESDARLYVFSSDYPHAEGGRRPLEHFESCLEQHDAADKDRFYETNFLKVFAA